MRRAVEFGLAAAVAVGLHVAGFAALGGQAPAGVEAAGAGGDALIMLAASDGSVAALIAKWERPPELDLPAILQPRPVEAEPVPDIADAAPISPPVQPDLPVLPKAEALPAVAAAPPPPGPKPKPDPAPDTEREPDPQKDSETLTARPKAAEPESAPMAAQVAAGDGGTVAAGKAGTAQAATASGAAAANLKAEWGADIRARIERRKSYPRDGHGATGTVKLRLVVSADGRLVAVGVAVSSGSDALDQAALRAVQKAGRLPKAPKGLGQGEVSFTLPVSFKP